MVHIYNEILLSHKKKNKFKSVLMWWMNLESVIQSEVIQKQKNKYSILTHEFQKNIYFCFIDYAKAFDCVDHNQLWKILKEKGIPDHLTCLL